MAAYTRAQVIAYITDQITANGTNAITGTILNAVLDYMVDRIYLDSEISVTADGVESTDLQSAIDEILDISWDTSRLYKAGAFCYNDGALYISISDVNEGFEPPNATYWTLISNGDAMTPAEIVTALETITVHSDMLSGTKVDYDGSQSLTTIVGRLDTRQNIAYDSEFSYGLNNLVLSGGVLYRSKTTGNAGNALSNDTYWEALTSAEAIATLLNTITTVADMVKAERVSYAGSTVKAKLDNVQNKLTSKRLQYEGTASSSFTIAGVSDAILQMAINRVPYQGIYASAFDGESLGYDFRWQFSGSDIILTMNSSIGVLFEDGDLVDIIF